MLRLPFALLLLAGIPAALAQSSVTPGALIGSIEDKTYVSPTGTFRIVIPVLAELGGRVTDTDNVVIFQDDFNVLCTVAAFPMDATQRWEHSTRGAKDYLAYFFANYVMPDMQNAFRGARVESARYTPSVANGALLTYVLLPGGSMFAQKLPFLDPNAPPPEAKRGNLVFVRNDWVYVLSIELAEHVLAGSSYKKTPTEEDDILRNRLIDLYQRIVFTKRPGADKPADDKSASRPSANPPVNQPTPSAPAPAATESPKS